MLNSQYILMQDLQEYFVDKDTGLPLSAGIVTFYSDINRTTLKNIYTISGSPPNYSYVPLPNPLTLTSVGTPSDGAGNDVPLYYFPFDANDNVELYYITVTNAGLEPQFTREAWPNFAETGNSGENLFNYVPDGQFLIHSNVPSTSTTVTGQINAPITYIGQGGWTFERPMSSTATDFVVFQRFGSSVSIPSANPRYACRVSTTVPNSGDTFKDLRLKFNDVNKFASTDQEYTLSFSAQTNTGNSTVLNINLIKNFGTGGSASTTTNIETLTIQSSYTIFNVPFTFGVNTGKTIGALNDDFLQLAWTFPTSTTFDISITDIVLTPGNVLVTEFPQTPNASFLYQSIAGWLDVPDYNGMNLYLPFVLTPYGATYDTSEIGMVKAIPSVTPPKSYLNLDGAQYASTNYSSDGIPYKRLFNYLYNSNTLITLCGNGIPFVNSYITGSTTNFRLTANTAGTVTNSSDGIIPTGFTFSNITTGQSAALFNAGTSGIASNTQTIFINTANGFNTTIGAGTSGFTVAALSFGTAVSPQIESATAIGPATLAGKYFTISNPTTNFYFWWKVDGAGSNPSPGGTGIEMDIFSVYNANDVSRIISEAANGFHIDNIQTIAASGMTAGCYFNFYTQAALHYYCYYIIGGVGSDPLVAGAIAIPVSIASNATAAQVLTATVSAINSVFFAVPDFRGMFLRGHNGSATFIQGILDRISLVNSASSGDVPGSLQYDGNLAHIHGATVNSGTNILQNGGAVLDSSGGTHVGVINLSVTIGVSGIAEARPYNQQVNWIMKY